MYRSWVTVQSVCVRSADGWFATCTSQLKLVNYRPWSSWACSCYILSLSRSAHCRVSSFVALRRLLLLTTTLSFFGQTAAQSS